MPTFSKKDILFTIYSQENQWLEPRETCERYEGRTGLELGVCWMSEPALSTTRLICQSLIQKTAIVFHLPL